MRDDPSVIALVTRAANSDQDAWNEIIERYAPLVWSICQRNQLSRAEASDVSQNVWLRLADQLHTLRDPATVPGWLASITQRECCQSVRGARQAHDFDRVPGAGDIPSQAGVVEQELFSAELHAALREAFSQLPPSCQQLLAQLIQDPRAPHAQTGIPAGSAGPNHRQCLDRLRRHPAVAALIT